MPRHLWWRRQVILEKGRDPPQHPTDSFCSSHQLCTGQFTLKQPSQKDCKPPIHNGTITTGEHSLAPHRHQDRSRSHVRTVFSTSSAHVLTILFYSTAKKPDDVVITLAIRTPLAKGKKGGFKDTDLDFMVYSLLKKVLEKSKIDPNVIEDVCMGNVRGNSYQTQNPWLTFIIGLRR